MEKRKNKSKNGSIRRWIRKMIASLIKRQNPDYLEQISGKLQDIEDLIEILARETVRQSRSKK